MTRFQRLLRSWKPCPAPAARPRFAPRVEPLEGRDVPSTLTVTSAADAGPGTLRAIVAAAQPGDVVQFASTLRGQTIHLTSGEVAVSTSITIRGPGANLLDVDAGGLSRAFSITSADVTIAGLTVSGGRAPIGGGILVTGGSLALTSGVIADNAAVSLDPTQPARGGGVAVFDGALAATGTTFRNNQAWGASGADRIANYHYGEGGLAEGGAVYAYSAALTLTGGAFADNQVVGGTGFAASVGGGTPGAWVFYNGFGGYGSGGGVYVGGGTAVVSGTTFAGNVARGGRGGDGGDSYANGFGGGGAGGGLLTTGAAVSVSNASFTNNLAVGGRGGDGGAGVGYATSSSASFAYNGRGGGGNGGGIYVGTGSLSISGGSLTGNRAVGGDGGQSTAPIAFNGQAGSASGGGMRAADSWGAGPVGVSRVTFRSNAALGGRSADGASWGSASGGAIAAPNGLMVSGSRFDANVVKGDEASGAGVDAGYAGLEVRDSTFTGNRATGTGPFRGATGGVLSAYTMTVTGSTFAGNRATGAAVNGGVIDANLLTLSDSRFTANEAVADDAAGPYLEWGGGTVGGGVILSSAFTITNTAFTSNLAAGGAGAAGSPGGGVWGGVIGFESHYKFASSYARYVADAYSYRISGSSFTDNRAVGGDGGDGAAGRRGGAGGEVFGGALYTLGGLRIADTRFTGTAAIGGDGGAGGAGADGGGGGRVRGGAVAVYDDWFSSFRDPQPITLLGVSITATSARGGDGGAGLNGGGGGGVQGGAAYVNHFFDPFFVFGVTRDDVVDVTVAGARVSGNRAEGGAGGAGGRAGAGGSGGEAQGGGLYLTAGTILYYTVDSTITVTMNAAISDATLTGNTAQGGAGGSGGTGGAGGLAAGGGLYLGTYGRIDSGENSTVSSALLASLDGDRFSGNAAEGGKGGKGATGGVGGDALGGGLYAEAGAVVTLTDGAVTGNHARGGKGGSGAADGAGWGGGVYLAGLGSHRIGTLIRGNLASTGDDDVYGLFS